MSKGGTTPTPLWRMHRQAEVDWSDLTHAYGSAADLPSLFDQLCSSDASHAQRAVSEIALRICHQGAAIEQATAPSIVVLMEIAAAADPPLAARIVGVLCTISESLGTWARVMDESPLERRSTYIPKVRWECDVMESLKGGYGRLDEAISREASPLRLRLETLLDAISKAEDGPAGSV